VFGVIIAYREHNGGCVFDLSKLRSVIASWKLRHNKLQPCARRVGPDCGYRILLRHLRTDPNTRGRADTKSEKKRAIRVAACSTGPFFVHVS